MGGGVGGSVGWGGLTQDMCQCLLKCVLPSRSAHSYPETQKRGLPSMQRGQERLVQLIQILRVSEDFYKQRASLSEQFP